MLIFFISKFFELSKLKQLPFGNKVQVQELQIMSSRLQNTVAELHKLKNQIRLQLNQIRPFKDYSAKHQNSVKKTQKKSFPDIDHQTSITPHLLLKPQEIKVERKKSIEAYEMRPFQFNRSQQKKHFPNHYNYSVSTEMDTKRTKSSYLNIRPQRKQSHSENFFGNSLVGLGKSSQTAQKSKSSIRVFPAQYIRSIGKSSHKKKSLFQ